MIMMMLITFALILLLVLILKIVRSSEQLLEFSGEDFMDTRSRTTGYNRGGNTYL